mgnify:FL=1
MLHELDKAAWRNEKQRKQDAERSNREANDNESVNSDSYSEMDSGDC